MEKEEFFSKTYFEPKNYKQHAMTWKEQSLQVFVRFDSRLKMDVVWYYNNSYFLKCFYFKIY